jgi:hypothetical protein
VAIFWRALLGDDIRLAALECFGALAARILISQIFILSGVMKVMDPAGTTAQMEGRGMFWIPFVLWTAAAIEIGAGLALLLGYKTRLASGASLRPFARPKRPYDGNDLYLRRRFLREDRGYFTLLIAHGSSWRMPSRIEDETGWVVSELEMALNERGDEARAAKRAERPRRGAWVHDARVDGPAVGTDSAGI